MEYVAHKWYSTSEYVDVDTGEIISKKQATQNYDIIKTTKKYEYGKYANTIKYTRECTRKRQLKLL